MAPSIKFAASGWQARIAEDFTVANVQLATEAIGSWVRCRGSSPALLVGYDRRFLSERFAGEVARVLSSQNIRVRLCSQAAPTPAIAQAADDGHIAGAITVTAGHSSGEYSGLRFSLPEAMQEINREIEHLQAANWSFNAEPDASRIETIDIATPYLNDIATKVDMKKIRDTNLSIGYDALYGCGAGYLDRVLAEHGIPTMLLHANRDVQFGGIQPEPSEQQLGQLKIVMKKNWLQLGIATGGDGERFGVLDEGGDFIPRHSIMALLIDYLVETRGWKNVVERSAGTTNLIDRVAQLHGLEIAEAPDGFQDGILACLLVTEMLASRGKTLKSQLKELLSRMIAVYNHA